MEFEDILGDIGGFGRYQKLLIFVVMIPTYSLLSMIDLDLVFMTNTPEHWCSVPEVAHSNLSLEVQRQLISPPYDASCSMHDVNYTRILQSGNLTVDPMWPTKKCSNGWQYDTSVYEATAVTRWSLVCHDSHYSSLALTMIFIGSPLTAPLYGFLADRFGRKPQFFILSLVMAVSEIASVFSPYFTLFLFLKAVEASVVTTVYNSGYVILLELVSPEVRSWANGATVTSWTLGLCLLPLIAWLTRDWINLSIVIASSTATILLYWNLLPESPRWLISEGRYEEAHATMTKISKMNGKTAHEGNQLMKRIEILGEHIQLQKLNEVKHSPLKIFQYPTLRKRFLLMTTCWITVYITYYGLQVNVKNLTGNEFLNFFLLSVVEIPAHLATWALLGRIGRRWCMVLGFGIALVSCFIPVFVPPAYAIIGVAAAILAKAGASCAKMAVYQQTPEIFPTPLRCSGMALSNSIASASTLLMPYIVYLGKFGTFLPFLIFGLLSLIGGTCASLLPETLGKNLPQTVEHAENFEKDFKFWSRYHKKKEEKSDFADVYKARSGTFVTISVEQLLQLQQTVKDMTVKV